MSFKSLLHDDRYFADRHWHDRHWSDRYYTDRHWADRNWSDRYWNDHRYTALNGRYWNYWNHPYYYRNYVPSQIASTPAHTTTTTSTASEDTLRFNSHVPTRVYYPATVLNPATWVSPKSEIKIERMPLQRSNSFVTVSETKNETCDNDKYDCNYDYKYQEDTDSKSVKRTHTSSVSNMSKSMSNIQTESESVEATSSAAPAIVPVVNSVTYVYDNDQDKHRHVTYVKHTHADSGESLAGSLVRNSETFLPVNRSINVGPIFNGNSFGILSEHLTIRDVFNVAFQFKTTAQNGVLMIIVDRSSGDSFFIELYDSQLKATLYVDGEADSCWTDFTKPVLSNDIWSDVEVKIVNNRMSMTVRNETFTKTHRFPFRRPIRGDLFVAGYPSTATPPFCCRSKDFFVGEMRNFYLNNDGVKWYGTPSYGHPRLKNWYY